MRRGARPGGRIARSREQRRQRRRRIVLATILVACLPLPLAGATLAAFSDWDIVPDLTVGAGNLTVEADDGHLELGPLTPGPGASGALSFANRGTVNADLAVQFGTFDGLCPGPANGELLITVMGTSLTGVDLCAIGQDPVLINTDVPANVLSGLQVTVALTEGADEAWRNLTGSAEVRFLGAQPGGGFSDLDSGSLTIRTGNWENAAPWPPDLSEGLEPASCLPDSEYSWKIVVPTGGPWFFDLTNADLSSLASVKAALTGAYDNPHWQPIIVTPLGGGASKGVRVEAYSTDLDIIGTPFNDCIKVWNGKFTASGGSGDDILITPGSTNVTFYGGDGNDTLYSGGNGSGEFHGGGGNDLLYTRDSTGLDMYGGDGDDVLYSTGNGSGMFDGGAGNDVLWVGSHSGYDLRGGPGDDHLRGPAVHWGSTKFDGGPGHDVCEGAGTKVNCEEQPTGPAGASKMMMLEDDEALREGDEVAEELVEEVDELAPEPSSDLSGDPSPPEDPESLHEGSAPMGDVAGSQADVEQPGTVVEPSEDTGPPEAAEGAADATTSGADAVEADAQQ